MTVQPYPTEIRGTTPAARSLSDKVSSTVLLISSSFDSKSTRLVKSGSRGNVETHVELTPRESSWDRGTTLARTDPFCLHALPCTPGTVQARPCTLRVRVGYSRAASEPAPHDMRRQCVSRRSLEESFMWF